MLLTFPVEPPHKDEMLEIIAESVYANSSTLDGKRFANNFYMRRKEDAIDRVASNGKSSAAKVTSLADSKCYIRCKGSSRDLVIDAITSWS